MNMERDDMKKWFAEAKFGMMIHWGLYSLLGGEWRGRRMDDYIAEWAQQYFRIPLSEYKKLCRAAEFFDARLKKQPVQKMTFVLFR